MRKNLRQGMALAGAASPRSLLRYSLLGMLSAFMPPIAVYLGAGLVNRIAEARVQSLEFQDLLPIVIGLWIAAGVQRAVGAYMGLGRNLFVRRVELEAERRLLAQASKVDYLLGRHRKVSEYLYAQREQMYRSATRISLLTGLVTGTALALAYAFVAVQGVAGAIDPGGVVLVIGAFTSVSGTLGQISGTFVAVDQHTTFLDDYFSFLAIEPLVPVPAEPHPVPNHLTDGIEFDNVTFSYPGGTGPAVAGLNLHIRNGELVALVGENGAGKSTLVKLLVESRALMSGGIRASARGWRQSANSESKC